MGGLRYGAGCAAARVCAGVDEAAERAPLYNAPGNRGRRRPLCTRGVANKFIGRGGRRLMGTRGVANSFIGRGGRRLMGTRGVANNFRRAITSLAEVGGGRSGAEEWPFSRGGRSDSGRALQYLALRRWMEAVHGCDLLSDGDPREAHSAV